MKKCRPDVSLPRSEIQSHPVNSSWQFPAVRSSAIGVSFLILLSALIFFHKVIFVHRSFMPGLVVAQGVTGTPPVPEKTGALEDYPYLDAEGAAYIDQPATRFAGMAYRRFGIPLWNPYVAMGTPQLADLQSSVFYPLKIPLFAEPSPLMWDFYFIARIILSGFFMYLFCRLWGISRFGSLAASFVYMYCGHFILYIHSPRLCADILLPLILLFVELLVRKSSLSIALGLGIILGVMALGGTPPEISFAIGSFVFFYFLFRILTITGRSASVPRLLALFSIAGLTGVLISLPATVPFIEFLSHSYHTHHETGAVSLALNQLIFLFVPFFLGQHNFVMPYIGVVAATLGLVSLASRNNRGLVLFLFGFILIYLARTFGMYGTHWIGSLPLFQWTFFPKYFHSSFVFSLAVCAAIGVDLILEGKVTLRSCLLALVPVSLIVIVFFLVSAKNLTSNSELSIVATCQLAAFSAIILITALMFAFGRLQKVSYRVRAGALCSFVFIELFFYSFPLDYPRRADPFQGAPYINFLKQDSSIFRIFSLQGVLPPNYSTAMELSDIGANNGIFISRYISLMQKAINPHSGYGRPANFGRPDIHSKLLDLFNVKYLVAKSYLPLNPSRFSMVYDGEVKIFRNLHYMPRCFIVHDFEVIKSPPQILERMLSNEFDMRKSVIIEEDPNIPETGAGQKSGMPSASIIDYAPNKVVITASLQEEGLLVLTDCYYPGWRATVDGKENKILRADYLFRAVRLPAGDHTICFEYKPMSFYVPLALSLLTLFCVAGIFLGKAFLHRTGASGSSHISLVRPSGPDASFADGSRTKSSAGICSEDTSS
jgi:hypothetical protein